MAAGNLRQVETPNPVACALRSDVQLLTAGAQEGRSLWLERRNHAIPNRRHFPTFKPENFNQMVLKIPEIWWKTVYPNCRCIALTNGKSRWSTPNKCLKLGATATAWVRATFWELMWEGFGMNVAHPLEKQCGWWSRETSYALTESESRKPHPIFEACKGCDGGEIGELDSQVLLWHLTVSLQPSILHQRARRAASYTSSFNTHQRRRTNRVVLRQ